MGRGEHPNSRANLDKGKPFSEETARKAAEKSAEVRRANGMLSADLKEQLDEATIRAINDKIISLAKKGNLKAYELIRDGIGEKPTDKLAIGTVDPSQEALDDFFKRTDQETT